MEKTKLRFESLKDYDAHLKATLNDKEKRLNKLKHTIKNGDSNEIINDLSYLVKNHNYSFDSNDNYLSLYLLNNNCDEMVLRMFLSMKHPLNKKILTDIVYRSKIGFLSSDICEIFYNDFEKQQKKKRV